MLLLIFVPDIEVPSDCTATLSTSPSCSAIWNGAPGAPCGTPAPAAVTVFGSTVTIVPSTVAITVA
jgi:hypothetical protein